MVSERLTHDSFHLTAQNLPYFPRLGDLLSAFLKAAMKTRAMAEVSVQLHRHGSLHGGVRAGEIYVDDFTEETPVDDFADQGETPEESDYTEEPESYTDLPPEQSDAIRTPILYREEALGHLCARPAQTRAEHEEQQNFLGFLARKLAFMIKRHEAGQWTHRFLGNALPLVGTSVYLHRVDEFIEKASRVDLPVIISGALGTETTRVACAIHANSLRCDKPFTEVNCAALFDDMRFHQQLTDMLKKNCDGTLFLNGIDRLEPPLQRVFLAFLGSSMGQWTMGSLLPEGANLRILVSTNQALEDLVAESLFSPELLVELDFLRIHLPCLRERPEDIRPLIQYVFHKHKRVPQQCISLRAQAALEAYDWPQNLFEIEQVIARLVAMADGPELNLELLRRYAPELAPQEDEGLKPSLEGTSSSGSGHVDPLVRLAGSLLDRDFSPTASLHTSLQRAIRYIRQHFQEEIALKDLAKNAFVSPSHLSYLFKNELNTSFKTLLACLRIEKAKRLLARDSEARITDICLEAGFGDLSHFEKTFKRWTGCNPKDYRQQLGSAED